MVVRAVWKANSHFDALGRVWISPTSVHLKRKKKGTFGEIRGVRGESVCVLVRSGEEGAHHTLYPTGDTSPYPCQTDSLEK